MDAARLWKRTRRVFTAPLSAVAIRGRETAVVEWILFTGRRSTVTLALLSGVLLAFLGLALTRPVDMEQLLSETTTLQSLFRTLLRGAILVVSIVTSISSIVLSAEITDIMTEEERIDATLEFRRRAEGLMDADVSPGRPADFLQVILHSVHDEANALREVAGRSENREFAEQARSFADDVLVDARESAETLDGAAFGTFQVLAAGLHYDYSWQLNTARRLENQYGESLSTEESEALSELIETLKFFGMGREYFQSLYYKREIARLSSTLLYVSLPVIVFISYLILALDTGIIPNVPIGPVSSLSVFVLFAYTVSLAPYVVLTAHVIRVAAVTLRTLSAGPFILRQREEHDVVDLEMSVDPDDWDADGSGQPSSQQEGGGTDWPPASGDADGSDRPSTSTDEDRG